MMTVHNNLSKNVSATHSGATLLDDSSTDSKGSGDPFEALLAALIISQPTPGKLGVAPEADSKEQTALEPAPRITRGEAVSVSPLLDPEGPATDETNSSVQIGPAVSGIPAGLSETPVSGQPTVSTGADPLFVGAVQADPAQATPKSRVGTLLVGGDRLPQFLLTSKSIGKIGDQFKLDAIELKQAISLGQGRVSLLPPGWHLKPVVERAHDPFEKNSLLQLRANTEPETDGSNEKNSTLSLSNAAVRELSGGEQIESFIRPTSHSITAASELSSSTGDKGNDSSDGFGQEQNGSNRVDMPFASSASQSGEITEGFAAASADSKITTQLVNPLMELASQLANRETRSLRMQLHPKDLGAIELQITRDAGGRVSAHIAADLNVAHHALSAEINHLRESLEQAGLAVDRLEVSLGLNAGGNAQNQTTGERTNAPAFAQPGSNTAEQQTTIEQVDAASDERRLLNMRI